MIRVYWKPQTQKAMGVHSSRRDQAGGYGKRRVSELQSGTLELSPSSSTLWCENEQPLSLLWLSSTMTLKPHQAEDSAGRLCFSGKGCVRCASGSSHSSLEQRASLLQHGHEGGGHTWMLWGLVVFLAALVTLQLKPKGGLLSQGMVRLREPESQYWAARHKSY